MDCRDSKTCRLLLFCLPDHKSVGGKDCVRAVQDDLFYDDNTLKVFKGWLKTLTDAPFIANKKKQDAALRDWIAADDARLKKVRPSVADA